MHPRKLSILCLTALLPLAFAGAAAADSFLTLKTHQDAYQMGGQDVEAQDATVEMWIGDGKVSRDDGGNTIILRSDPDELLVINHKEESYARVELPFDFTSMLPEGMEAMAEKMKMSAEINAGDETKKVGDWTTRRWDIKLSSPMGLAVNIVMWSTEDLEIDYDTFQKLSTSLLTLQPGGQEIAGDLAKVKGYPVLQETTVNFGGTSYTTTEELISAEQKAAPDGIYDAPEGYTEKDLQAMGGAGGPGL